MPVDPNQRALYERDQRINERPAVDTYHPTAPGIPDQPQQANADADAAQEP